MNLYIQAVRDRELEAAGVRYAWVITHEYEMDADWDGNLRRLKGRYRKLGPDEEIRGPGGCTDEETELARKGVEFRLDYDGEGPAAKGRIWCSDAPTDPTDSMAAWAPRDDYGEGGYGAPWLFYKLKGKWVEP